SINTFHGGLTEFGEVIFTANTAAGQGLFSAFPGVTPIKLAQVGDAATGGPGGGVFTASAGNAPVAVALHGQAAPGGGAYNLLTVRPEALINNSGDIAFMADLTGGPGDSGIFIQRSGSGIELVVRQGQASGVGPFQTMRHSQNGWINESLALNHDGDLVFLGFVTGPSGDQIGGWR